MFADVFRTARLIVRPIALEDADPIFNAYVRDQEVTRFLTWRPHQTRDETVTYVTRCIMAPSDASRTYVLAGRDDHQVRGAFDLRREAPHRLTCGYVLARACWGQGLMTETLAEVVRWALCQDTIWRIGAVCDVENIASLRVMEKAGLTKEGILRRWIIHPNISDRPRDCISCARVR